MSEEENQAPEQEEVPAEAANLTKEEEENITDLIAKYDASGNGKLEYDEFIKFMQAALKLENPPANFLKQMRFLYDGMDTDGSHNLDKNEILTCFDKLKSKDFKYITKMIFRGADRDKSRKVTIDELKSALYNLGNDMDEKKFEEQCKVEFGGKKKELEYWEFYKLITGETIPKDSAERDPYEGKLPTKSKCCLLL